MDDLLAFLYVLVLRRVDGSLGHKVYLVDAQAFESRSEAEAVSPEDYGRPGEEDLPATVSRC